MFFSVTYFDQMISACDLVIGSTVLAATVRERRRRGRIARTCADRGESLTAAPVKTHRLSARLIWAQQPDCAQTPGAEGGEAFRDLG